MSKSILRIGVLVLVLVAVALGAWLSYRTWSVTSSETPRDVPSLVTGLKSSSRDVRIDSATTLATLGLEDASAHDGLVAAMDDPSESVRYTVADTLSKRGNPKSAKSLVKALKDPAPTVRAAAAFGLARIPDLAPADADTLMACIADTDPDVRRCVFLAADVRARAAKSPDDPRVRVYEPLAIVAMKDLKPVVRRTAAQKLASPPTGSIVESNKIALATADAIEDSDSTVRTVAVLAVPGLLKACGPKLTESTIRAIAARAPALVRGLINGDRQTRPEFQAALTAIGAAVRTAKITPDDETTAKTRAAYIEALATPGPDVKPLALSSLPAILPLIKPDAAFLKDTLQTAIADPATHAQGVNAARDLLNGPGVTDDSTGSMAIELLRPILKDKNPQVQGTAYTALWHSPSARKQGGADLRTELRAVTQTYIAALSDPDATTREVAAWCLSWTDPEDAAAALKALEAVKEDKEARVKDRVTKAITKLKAAGPPSASWPEPNWEPYRRGWGGGRGPGGGGGGPGAGGGAPGGSSGGGSQAGGSR